MHSGFATSVQTNKKIDSKTIKLLESKNININDITIIDEESTFTKQEIQKMREEDLILEKQGLKKVSVIYYIYNNEDSKSISSISPMATLQTKTIYAVRQYNTDTETISNTSHGMSYWLDMAINLTIGTYTKYIWKAYTILGLSTSNFLTTYHQGDMLTNHYQHVYSDKITQALNTRDNTWYSVVRRSQLDTANYVDCYTTDKNNKPVRASNVGHFTGYTQHYFDNQANFDWVYNEALANVSYCGMAITYDSF